MAWTTPIPDAVSALRDMLVACPSAVAFGLVQARFHYPTVDLTTEANVTRPCCEIDQAQPTRRESYAEQGVLGNPSGTLVAVIHAESSVSTLEELTENLCAELTQQSTGLYIRSATAGRASDLRQGQLAASHTTATAKAGFRSITITVEWGLTP